MFFIILFSVFVAEFSLMLVFHSLQEHFSTTAIILADAVLLMLLLFPLLYYFMYRPMRKHLNRALTAEKDLGDLSHELEKIVEERVLDLQKESNERSKAELSLEKNNQILLIINKLLLLSLEDLALEELLRQFIHLVTAFPKFTIKNQGAIHLADNQTGLLNMVAHRGLSQEIQTRCARVKFGTCLCGLTAQSKELIFADRIDHRHDITYDGIPPHGHYCIPILSSTKKLLGVFTLYTDEGQARDPEFEDILKAVANVAASIIEHKQSAMEKTNLSAQLRQAQKMEAIGTLAGGIAHDFNNILTAILGYSEMAYAEAEEYPLIKSDIEQVLQAGKRAKDLVEHILVFSRSGENERIPMQLDPIIKEALKLLRASLPATINISQNIDPGAGAVLADPTQIHQVLMNLCTNAAHAMEETGGTLEVKLSRKSIETSNLPGLQRLPLGDYVLLLIKDSGQGMDPLTVDRIFDPYFTTKEPGKGTGLGLSVVHGIITSYGGAILVRSIPGEGSVFQIYLPIVDQDDANQAPDTKASQHTYGTEKILVVDDEVAIVELIKRVLESRGYTVTAKNSSVEALQEFKNNPHNFDMIITDQAMPMLAGSELATEIMKIRPEIPIILCTGYSETLTKEKAENMGIVLYIKKPIIVDLIADEIRNIFDRKVRPALKIPNNRISQQKSPGIEQ
ncbi:response regulator [Thermodesulfobacteriota bacterium]